MILFSKRLRRLTFSVLALLALAGCKEETLALGKTAPALAVYDLAGNEATLAQWRGRTVYLNFWSVSCGGCIAEMPVLQRLSVQYAQRIAVVGVNTDPQSVDIQPIVWRQQIRFPVLRDQLGITQERYRVIGTPTSFIIDPQGKLLELKEGTVDEAQLVALFERLSKGA